MTAAAHDLVSRLLRTGHITNVSLQHEAAAALAAQAAEIAEAKRMNSAMAIDIVQTAAKLAAAEAERDRAIEVADAETKGVYSQYMLEAADAIAELRSTRIKLADTEASYCAMAKVARDAQSALEACRSALPRSFD